MSAFKARLALMVASWCALVLPGPARAVDGVIEIHQVQVEAGGGFPFVIDRPGSYRLTSDLHVVAPGVGAIQIAASHVSVDLNGFAIRGCSGLGCTGGPGTGPGIGVDDEDLRVGIRVRNGSVVGAAYHGIELGDHSIVEDLRVHGSGGSGLRIGGSSVVRRVSSVANVENGLIVHGSGSVARETTASNNGSFGILFQGAGIVSDSLAVANDNSGIRVLAGSRVEGSVAADNEAYGIYCQEACALVGNVARGNASDGIRGHEGSVVHANVARENDLHGLRISQGALAHGNASSENVGDGLYVTFGPAGFRENVLYDNGGGAVDTGQSATALDLGANQCGNNGTCANASAP